MEPPACQTQITWSHLFLLYSGTFCLKPVAKGRSTAGCKAFLALQHRRVLLGMGLLVCPFIQVIVAVWQLFCLVIVQVRAVLGLSHRQPCFHHSAAL